MPGIWSIGHAEREERLTGREVTGGKMGGGLATLVCVGGGKQKPDEQVGQKGKRAEKRNREKKLRKQIQGGRCSIVKGKGA